MLVNRVGTDRALPQGPACRGSSAGSARRPREALPSCLGPMRRHQPYQPGPGVRAEG